MYSLFHKKFKLSFLLKEHRAEHEIKEKIPQPPYSANSFDNRKLEAEIAHLINLTEEKQIY